MYFVTNMLKAPAPNLAPLTASIETLSAENKTLKAQVTRLQRDIKAIPKPETIDLSALETRLDRLETAEPQVLDPDLVTRLEALKEEGSDALDLSDILARIEVLETRPAMITTLRAPEALTAPKAEVNIAFPEAEILAVLDKAEETQGWLKKSLNKHISVQSEDNPRYLVELVVKNIETKNIDAAIAAFDKLPAEAKAAASDWRKTVESY